MHFPLYSWPGDVGWAWIWVGLAFGLAFTWPRFHLVRFPPRLSHGDYIIARQKETRLPPDPDLYCSGNLQEIAYFVRKG